MNYRHGYHAGNFADVVKHLALIAILDHLKKKKTGFSVIDTHAGRGAYDLAGDEAAKTGEAANGIGALRNLVGDLPAPLAAYLQMAQGEAYPGSPLIAAQLLRPQDRLTAIEKHPVEFATLSDVLSPWRNAVAENGDGYARLLKLLPPPTRRGLAVIDPPFEAVDEFAQLGRAVTAALRKFATGVYLVWYPVKSQSAADAFVGEVLAGGAQKALAIDTAIAAPEGKLARAALLVVNPPFGFAGQMRVVAGHVASPMGGDIRIRWVAGAE